MNGAAPETERAREALEWLVNSSGHPHESEVENRAAIVRAALSATATEPAEEIAKRDRMLDALEAQLREAVEYADRCRAAIIGITGVCLKMQRAAVPVAPSEENEK